MRIQLSIAAHYYAPPQTLNHLMELITFLSLHVHTHKNKIYKNKMRASLDVTQPLHLPSTLSLSLTNNTENQLRSMTGFIRKKKMDKTTHKTRKKKFFLNMSLLLPAIVLHFFHFFSQVEGQKFSSYAFVFYPFG